MILYEYDTNGWLVGWHEDAQRPNSTPLDFRPVPPAQARWNGAAWVADSSRQDAQATTDAADRTVRNQALQLLRNYDPATATAADVKNTLAALIRVFRDSLN